MALVTKFSAITPVKGAAVKPKFDATGALTNGAYVSLTNLDTQFETGPALKTILSTTADKLSTTLDAPAGAVPGYQAIGFSILAGHTLDMSGGDDSLDVIQGIALGAIGINIGLGGTLDMGAGNDKFRMVLTGAGSVGVNNQGKLLTGAGLEILKAEGDLSGLINGSITNTAAVVDTGTQDDKFDVFSATGNAIENYGTISLGADNEGGSDKLTGNSGGHGLIAAPPAYTPGKFGIYNTGTIKMGGGLDVLDALTGGFGGGGTYLMGPGKDSVSGFGWGTFDGGPDATNGITLPDGFYRISYTVKPIDVKSPASGTIQRSDDGGLTWNTNPGTADITTMTFTNFDGIGGQAPVPLGSPIGHFANAVINPLTGATTTVLLQTLTIDKLGQATAATWA